MSAYMKITESGQITIPRAMRKKHGLSPRCDIECIDRPDGILIVKAGQRARGREVLATLQRGGKVTGRTAEWLRLTRGTQ